MPPEYSALIASSGSTCARTRTSHAASWPRRRAGTSTPPTIRAPRRDILIAANKQVLTQPQLVVRERRPDGKSYYKDRAGHVGTQTLGVWKGYVGFLFAAGVLTDADGKKLTSAPDYSSYFTNAYLPRQS